MLICINCVLFIMFRINKSISIFKNHNEFLEEYNIKLSWFIRREINKLKEKIEGHKKLGHVVLVSPEGILTVKA